MLCPDGTTGQISGLSSAEQCTPCPPGEYCEAGGTVTGTCTAGFYCRGGNVSPTPVAEACNASETATGFCSGQCPLGHFCLGGTTAPTPCGVGKYLPTLGGAKANDCLSCEAGMWCGSSGLAAVSGPCDGGYYCPGLTQITEPAPPAARARR